MPAPYGPGDRSPEILARLDLMERKLDWIARRVAQRPTPPQPPVTTAQATAAPSPASQDSPAQDPAAGGPAAQDDAGHSDAAGRASSGSAAAQDDTARDWAAPSEPGPTEPEQPEGEAGSAPEDPEGSAPAVPQPPALRDQGAQAPAAQGPRPYGYTVPPATARPAAPAPLLPAAMRSEGNLGRYLLSGAAALLVVLAAVSLIALVWDSIPDGVKVGALGLLGLSLVAGGTRLAGSRPHLRVAAATMTGTGGALGFVSIIGAVLLAVLPMGAAFTLMAAWGAALLILSRLTAQVFTAVVSTIGALVTIGFASWRTWWAPEPHLGTWALACGYAVVLAAITTVLARRGRPMPLAAWYPVTSLVVLGAALLMAPSPVLVRASSLGAIALTVLTCAAMLFQQLDSSRLLWSAGYRSAAGADWAVAGIVLGFSLLRLVHVLDGTAQAELLTALTSGLALCLLAAVSTLMLDSGPAGWRRRCAPVHLVTALVLGVLAALATAALALPVVLVVALTCVPVLRERFTSPLLTLSALAGLPLLLSTRRPLEVVGLIAALAAIHALTAVLESTPGWERAPQAPGKAPAIPPTLRISVWIMAASTTLILPSLVDRLLPRGSGTALPPLVFGIMLAALLWLGLTHPQATVRRLLALRLAGRFPQALPAHGPQPAAPTQAPPHAWLGWVLGALGVLTMLSAAMVLMDSLLWRMPLIAVAAALAVLANRIVWAWFGTTDATLASALLSSLTLWSSALILSGSSVDSVLMTILILLTGAACIILGFRLRATVLRHYGLGLVLIAVLKLAAVDLGSHNSIMRVLALAVAGLVCFALSLAYNRAAADEQASQRPSSSLDPSSPQ
ncbi:hypothetical protein NSA19_04975 [Actinomyces bowdenii]|uniref:hypothetical protein n=1 Tax=Actinomyces bowdenii TaxID=131109 RepID=UPI00214B94B6|nr:hypothetical protein [Actinomyces bowdenii]MCR2052208.1 hypothetical protein [Actinomyces bowdenii]